MRPLQHIFARRDFLIRVLIFLIACLIGPAAFAATADDIGAAPSIIRAQEEAWPATTARPPTVLPHQRLLQSFFRNPHVFMSMTGRLHSGRYPPPELLIKRGQDR